MDWTNIIITAIGVLTGGGLGSLLTLKQTRRKSEFEVWERQIDKMQSTIDAERENHRKDIEFERSRYRSLVEQSAEKDTRFDEQTKRLRECQDRELLANEKVVALTKEAGAKDVLLAQLRCDDEACPFRQPPTAKTPPPPGTDKTTYHQKRINR